MKTKALFLLLLLSLSTAQAATQLFDVEFSDGRHCKKCVFETKSGCIISVKDSKGDEWIDTTRPMELKVYKSGHFSWSYQSFTTPAGSPPETLEPPDPISTGPSVGTILLKALAAGAGAYAATPRPQQQLRNTSCHTYGSQTNCMSY